MAEFTGTSGGDDIDGSTEPDDIYGDAGDDTLFGHDGDDGLDGDDGDDDLSGGEGNDYLDGGAGNDNLSGGTGGDTFVLRDGYDNDIATDFSTGSDTVLISSNGINNFDDIADRLDSDANGNAVLTLDDGSSLTFIGVKAGSLTASDFRVEPPPVCFVRGVKILTSRGEIAVEDLRLGDIIVTEDDTLQPLIWIGQRRKIFGHQTHNHHPIVIPKGAFGHNLPQRALAVSPQHQILIATPRHPNGCFAKAKGLVGYRGVFQNTTLPYVDYFQLLLPKHSVIFAQGIGVESFWPGPFALGSLGLTDVLKIEALFPGIEKSTETAYGKRARTRLSLKDIQTLQEFSLVPIKEVA